MVTAEVERCPHCGATENLAWRETWIGGQGYVFILDCKNAPECWARWDKANLGNSSGGEPAKVYDTVSAHLVSRLFLFCAMWPYANEQKPDCKYLLPTGYCTATERNQCLTLKEILEKAEERKGRSNNNGYRANSYV